MTAQGLLVSGSLGQMLVGPPSLTGIGPPSNSKPGILGQEYFDTSTTPRTSYTWSGATWLTDSSAGGTFTNLTVTGQSTLGATDIEGTTTINTTSTATTTIGNTTGGTAITGDETVTGNINIDGAGHKLSIHGGAVTDFIGTATLVAGTVTIANTNILATDRVFVTRNALNGSPVLGFLDVTITAGTSFTVASFTAADAAAITDVSSFSYVIFRQIAL